MATVDWLFGNTAILIFFFQTVLALLWYVRDELKIRICRVIDHFYMEHLPKSWIASRKKLFFWNFFLRILFSYQNESDLTQWSKIHILVLIKLNPPLLPQTKHFYTKIKKKQLELRLSSSKFFLLLLNRSKYRERKKMLQAGIILRHKEVTK